MKSPGLHEELKRRRPVVPWKQNSEFTFVESLKACAKKKDLYSGERLHGEVVEKGLLDKSPYIASVLIHMYAKCGALSKAQKLLEEFDDKDVVCWNALIAGYAQHGQGREALKCFEKMREEGFSPDPVSFICILKACGNIQDVDKGIEIHDEVLNRKFLLVARNVVLGNALVDMYAKCGMLAKAQQVLEALPARNAVTWNTLIAGYAQHNQGKEALDSFDSMQREGFFPNDVTFTCILKACGSIGAIDKGKQIHDEIASKGLLEKNVLLSTSLVDMYAKCGVLAKAHEVLEALPFRDTVCWSALISGYAQDGHGDQALNYFGHMQREGLIPNDVTYICILKACGGIEAIDKGKRIHREILDRDLLKKSVKVGNALVDMYAKCGMLVKAQQVLEELPVRNVISWNALIAGYAQGEQGHQALDCFARMQKEGLSPDDVTFTCILKACGNVGSIDKGKEIHEEIVNQDLLKKNTVLSNALVDMYAKCGLLSHAWQLLEELPVRDRISWNAIITAYAEDGRCDEAFNCYSQMVREGITPNEVTFACILKACGCTGAIDKGKQIHHEIVNRGLLKNNMLGTALVDMYAKCGNLKKAHEVLRELPERNVVSWNALISGYSQNEQGHEALNCFECMQREGISPNIITLTCVLKACGSIGAIDKGKQVHDEIINNELLEKHIVLGNALVDMYAKCGMLVKARRVLEDLPVRDIVSWSTLIAGYAERGNSDEALNCFHQMQREGCCPNEVTFLCVLNACGHSGKWDEAQMYYDDMSKKYGITPTLEHHTSMVVLLGCAGRFQKAMSVIKAMPDPVRPVIWLTLLCACRKWGNVKLGRLAFEKTMQLDITLGAAYVLMTNIYAAAGMLEEAEKVEAMREIHVPTWKKPGMSVWVDATGNVHSFPFGDLKHPQSKEIYAKVASFDLQILGEGYYSPRMESAIHHVSDGLTMCCQCVKMAIACGLINTHEGESIHIMNTTCICDECHLVTSNISRLEKRKIIIRDPNNVHIFEDGTCTCQKGS